MQHNLPGFLSSPPLTFVGETFAVGDGFFKLLALVGIPFVVVFAFIEASEDCDELKEDIVAFGALPIDFLSILDGVVSSCFMISAAS
jgi:hypothetical protein